MGAGKIRVVKDSNLVLNEVQGSFTMKEITLAPYRIIAEKLMASFKQVLLEHIPGTTNRYADALATLGSKLTFIEEQLNIVVIRRKAQAIDAVFLEETSEDDDWRKVVKREFSNPSEELSIKYPKDYINVVVTLYKHPSG
ncbi:uncharacterized protein [Pyrus communis]|uniref:uncharacterized protein n=1 Tax=Pyrus communis TaxID=23211 RepID=UPI0035C1C24B